MVFILAAFFPVSERHDQISADILDIEGSVIVGETAQAKGVVIQVQLVEIGVEDFNAAGLEVGGVELRPTLSLSDRATFIDCLADTILQHHGIRIHVGIPSRNGSVLGDEQENRLYVWRHRKTLWWH